MKRTRGMWILAAGAVLTLAVSAAGSPDKPFTSGRRLVADRFAEVPTDRIGYRKYVGTVRKCTVAGTLLGIDDDREASIPAGAVGVIALGHSLLYFGNDFTIVQKPGRSVVYTPAAFKLPAELLK